MTFIMWTSAGIKDWIETDLSHTCWQVGDLIPIEHEGKRIVLRVDRRVVPLDESEPSELRCVIADEETASEITGEAIE